MSKKRFACDCGKNGYGGTCTVGCNSFKGIYPEIREPRNSGKVVLLTDHCPACNAPVVERKNAGTRSVSKTYKCGGVYEPKPQCQTHTDVWWGRCEATVEEPAAVCTEDLDDQDERRVSQVETTQAHSPLPWRTERAMTGRKGYYIRQSANLLAFIEEDGPIDEANAAFICLAVNNHQKLVEALTLCESQLRSLANGATLNPPGLKDVLTKTADRARAALDSVKEGKR